MRQALGPGALGRPRGIGWRGRWEAGLGWGTHVNPWLIHVNVWQKCITLQYCKVISLQLIKINEKKIKKKKKSTWWRGKYSCWVFLEHSIWRLWQVVEGGSDRKWGWGTSSVQFSRSVMSNSLWPHGLQHARLPCPSSTPEACSNSCPLSWWCHPTISSSVAPFPPAFNLAQHQGLFQRVSFLHQAAKELELQL